MVLVTKVYTLILLAITRALTSAGDSPPLPLLLTVEAMSRLPEVLPQATLEQSHKHMHHCIVVRVVQIHETKVGLVACMENTREVIPTQH